MYAFKSANKRQGHGFDSKAMQEVIKCIPWMQYVP